METKIKIGDNYDWGGEYFDQFVINGRVIDKKKISPGLRHKLVEKKLYTTKYQSGVNKVVSIEEVDFCGEIHTQIILDNGKEFIILKN
jgi:hypothetical protein